MNKNWLTHNLGLKILAFGFAIITWIYVNGELIKARLYDNYPSKAWQGRCCET